MAIVKPAEMNFSKQKFSMIIYGTPGIGKTTLALSAPKAILIDFDHGVSRVAARHRTATSICDTYEDVLNDVNSPEMKEFETVVIDTGGSFVTYLKDWAFRNKSDARTKTGQFNSLKGFGYVKSEFNSFTEQLKKVLDKNVIYVFHSTEEKDKDGNPTQRLMCEGAARTTVWNGCDFGGYVQMLDGKRVITFSPEQEFFAKGSHGISGRREIPELTGNTANDFISKIFDEARQNIADEENIFAPQRKQYETVMKDVAKLIDGIKDAKSANAAAEQLPKLEHALTSLQEARALLKDKTKELKLKYVKGTGYTEDKPETDAKAGKAEEPKAEAKEA